MCYSVDFILSEHITNIIAIIFLIIKSIIVIIIIIIYFSDHKRF